VRGDDADADTPALGERLLGTLGEHARDRVVLGPGDPRLIVRLDGDLAGDVVTAEALVRRQPGGGVPVTLGAVGRRVDAQQVQRVVGKTDAALVAPLLRALLPRVTERDDVVDVDLARAAALERDPRRGERSGV
jgi:hypothetical protein